MALSVLLVVNTLGLSAFAAEGTASTQQSVTVSGMSDPAQDPAEESNEQLPPDYEAEPDEQPAQDSEDDPDEQPAQDSEDGAKEQLPPDSEDKENEEQLEAPVEQDEGVSRDAVHIAEDTFVLAGGTITGNESDGGAIVPAGSSSKFCIGDTNPINVTGNMIPHGDEFNVYLKNDRLITVEAVPADGSQIGITTANLPVAGTNVQNYVKFADVSAGVSAARAAGAFSSDAGFEVYDVDSSLYLRYNRIATWSELQDALDNGGEAEWFPAGDPDGDWIRIIRLTDDITAGNGDRALHFHHNFDDDEIILDLRGHTIDRGLAGLNSFQSDGYVLHMDGGELIIRDSAGDGAIKGGNSDYAGGVYVENGTLTLESGAITGNRAYDGGGVYIRDGERRQHQGHLGDAGV